MYIAAFFALLIIYKLIYCTVLRAALAKITDLWPALGIVGPDLSTHFMQVQQKLNMACKHVEDQGSSTLSIQYVEY